MIIYQAMPKKATASTLVDNLSNKGISIEISNSSPDSRDDFLTLRAMPVDHPVFLHIKTESIDQELATSMAVGFLSIVSGNIAGINIFQPRFIPDLGRSMDAFGWG